LELSEKNENNFLSFRTFEFIFLKIVSDFGFRASDFDEKWLRIYKFLKQVLSY